MSKFNSRIKRPRLPYGFGSIHYLGDNRSEPWRARVTIDYNEFGSAIYDEVGCYETYEDAYTALLTYHQDSTLFNNKKTTFREVYQMFWNEKESTLSKDARRSYTSAFDNCSQLHNISFTEIKLSHLQNAVNKLGDKYSAKRKMKTLFNQMYDYAIAHDITTKKYSVYITLGTSKQSDIHSPFSEKEKNTLWIMIDIIPYVDIILAYIYTGFRPSELLDIECDKDINLKEWYLQGGSKTEAGIDRIVPIHPKIQPIIKKWYDKGHKYLITNTKGNKMTYDNWKRIFKKIMKSIDGIDSKHLPHDTRHTFATDTDNVGANPVSIERIMGHASDGVTNKVYKHKDIEELRKAIELLP